MIQAGTAAFVSDNCGARVAVCIKVLGGTRRRYASVGDLVKVSIKDATTRGRVRKGEVHSAVVVRTRHPIQRGDGTYVRFGDNSVVLLNAKHEPIGTRVFGPIAREVKRSRFIKVVPLAPEVV